MKKSYLLIILLLHVFLTKEALAQYSFTDSNLNPYSQNFNSLTGNVAMTGNQVSTIPELYAEADFSGTVFQPTLVYANDGQIPNASYYHFGPASGANASERAFGGIGGFLNTSSPVPGVGYVGIRFKNSSAQTITNLEIGYAMEQWYNSTFSTAAQVEVSYQVSAAPITGLVAGTWTAIPELGVAAPSTATTIGARDGNAASNRRVMNTTIGLALQPNQEVMIRWAYALNSSTNGNGLSIDDVVVSPQTKIFYSKQTGDLNATATWGINNDGTGSAPDNFTDANQTFYVQSPDATTPVERIGGTAWVVSGTNSKIVVGTVASPATLRIGDTKNIIGTVDVNGNSYFYNNHPTNPGFTLGKLATTSLVEYVSADNPQSIQATQYGNLTLTGGSASSDRTANKKELGGNVVVTGALAIGDGSNLVLGTYNLTVLGSITSFSRSAYVLTDGTGRLRIRVPRASNTTTPGTKITFPVGSSYTSYTPVTLLQSSTSSDDVFEVRMLEGVFKTYDPTTYAGSTPIGTEAVNKTWLISKEVPGNPATVTMTLQWNADEATSNFVATQAHINHYTSGAWDVYRTEMGAAGNDPFIATRSGVTNFSPFAVSSRVDGALPVELVRFEARRTGPTVACSWATASEKNSESFVVERSRDGKQFATLGQVAGAGHSSQQRTYAFEDKAPMSGTAYYRLRQIDTDGSTSFSPIVTVLGTELLVRATAVPNPSTGHFELWTPTAAATAIEVTTIVGARVLVSPPVVADDNHLRFDLSGQPAGVYLVRLQTAAGSQVIRVVKN